MTQQPDHDKSIAPKCPKCGCRFYGRSLEQMEAEPRWPCPDCGAVYDARSFVERIAAADRRFDEAFRAIEQAQRNNSSAGA